MTYRRAMRTLPLTLAALFVAACAEEEEPVANRFERTEAEIRDKARTYEGQVENEIAAAEARLDNEADAFLNAAAAANAQANSGDEAATNATR